MSRVAKNPISVPSGVDVALKGQDVTVKGTKGVLAFAVHNDVVIKQEEAELLNKSSQLTPEEREKIREVQKYIMQRLGLKVKILILK